jgi:HEAT repeat protein
MTALRFSLLPALLVAIVSQLYGDAQTVATDEATLREAGVKTDGASLLEFIRRRTLSEADQARLADTVRRLGDSDFGVREQAMADLLAAGRSAIPFLRPALDDADVEIARRARRCLQAVESSSAVSQAMAVVRLIADRRPEGATEALLNYLPFVDDDTLEEELLTSLGIVGVRDGKPDRLLLDALQDRAAVRRAAAALILGRLPEPHRPRLVRQLLTDTDPRVRLRAAQGLVAGKDREAIPALLALLSDGPLATAWPAEDLLCQIAGEHAPSAAVGAGQEAERRKCREAWEAWWRQHNSTIDLTKLDLGERMIGLTLICAADGYNGGKGKVWEVGPDGKTRWEINDVQYPVDAQMLPGNRVLIAEQSGRRVTERDLTGKILWSCAVNDSVIAAQRLPNGNTFIGTYNSLYEVNREGETVVRYPGHKGTIWSACKLRNGQVAYMGSTYTLAVMDERGTELRSIKIDFSGIGLVKPEPLPGGRFLVGQRNNIVEVDDKGAVIWQSTAIQGASSGMRLPNGNVICASQINRRVVELDRNGKLLWEQKLEGSPMRIRRR